MRALALLLASTVAAAARAAPADAKAPGRGPQPPATAPADPLDARRAAVADELMKLGAALQREISRGDVEALLARVPAGGLRCGEGTVPRAHVARDLRAPGSWLHGVLFGGPGYAPPPGGPASLRAFFDGAREIAVLVSFRRDPRAGALGRPCLEYRARDLSTPGAPFCFEPAGGRWWLTASLYPCP